MLSRRSVKADLVWKLKLVSAIILVHNDIDYTEFGLKVFGKCNHYPIVELKMMSHVKNPDTFEKLFEPSTTLTAQLENNYSKKKNINYCDLCRFKTNHLGIMKRHKLKMHKIMS